MEMLMACLIMLDNFQPHIIFSRTDYKEKNYIIFLSELFKDNVVLRIILELLCLYRVGFNKIPL